MVENQWAVLELGRGRLDDSLARRIDEKAYSRRRLIRSARGRRVAMSPSARATSGERGQYGPGRQDAAGGIQKTSPKAVVSTRNRRIDGRFTATSGTMSGQRVFSFS